MEWFEIHIRPLENYLVVTVRQRVQLPGQKYPKTLRQREMSKYLIRRPMDLDALLHDFEEVARRHSESML